MKQFQHYLFIAMMTIFTVGCIVDTSDDDDISPPQKMLYTVKVDKIDAIKSCEGDGISGKADIYTRMTLHKNDVPGGSSWAVLAEATEVVLELFKGQSVVNPGIETSVEISPFDGMRVEHILYTREVDPNGTQVREQDGYFMVYDETLGCFVEESSRGQTDVCILGSVSGSHRFIRTYDTRLFDHNCDVVVTWTASIEPIE